MTTEDSDAINMALRLAIRRCECGGCGRTLTWNMDGGAPTEKCKRCAPYRVALAKVLRLTRYRMTG